MELSGLPRNSVLDVTSLVPDIYMYTACGRDTQMGDVTLSETSRAEVGGIGPQAAL